MQRHTVERKTAQSMEAWNEALDCAPRSLIKRLKACRRQVARARGRNPRALDGLETRGLPDLELEGHIEEVTGVGFVNKAHLSDTVSWLRRGSRVAFVGSTFEYWHKCLVGDEGVEYNSHRLTISLAMRTKRATLESDPTVLLAPVSEIDVSKGREDLSLLLCHRCHEIKPSYEHVVCPACDSMVYCSHQCMADDLEAHREMCQLEQESCQLIWSAASKRTTYPLVNCIYRNRHEPTLCCRLPIPLTAAITPPLLPTDVLLDTSADAPWSLVHNSQHISGLVLRETVVAEATRQLARRSSVFKRGLCS